MNYFEYVEIQQTFKDDNKKLRDVDRFTKQFIGEGQEIALIRKVHEKMLSKGKYQKMTDVEYIK